MFRIKNANRMVVNLRTLFPKQKITRAFETLDPYADNFFESLIAQLTANGEARFAEVIKAFPTLSEAEVLRLSYAFFKSEPENQAILLSIAKRGALASVAQDIEAQYPPSSEAATYLLKGETLVLPGFCCTALPTEIQLRYLLAKWAHSSTPNVLQLVQKLSSFKGLKSLMLQAELQVLVGYLKAHSIRVTKCEPEATLLLPKDLLSGFMHGDVADEFFLGGSALQHLEDLANCGLRSILVSVNNAWEKLEFDKLNELFERVPNALIDHPLQPDLQAALKKRMISSSKHTLAKRLKRKKNQTWNFMDQRVATALSHLLGFKVPRWAIGDHEAFSQILVDQNLLQCFDDRQLQKLINEIGMPVMTACAAQSATQKLVKNYPGAYDPLPLSTIWRAVNREDMFKVVGWPKITLESLTLALNAGIAQQKLVWLSGYLKAVDALQKEAIQTLLLTKHLKLAARVIESTDPCWLQVPIKACVENGLWSVVLQADAKRVMDEVPRRFLVDKILGNCRRKAFSRDPFDRIYDDQLLEAYRALTSNTALRRHFVTSLLERSWCTDHKGTGYLILGGRRFSYVALATELLRCTAFVGDRDYRKEVVVQGLKSAKSQSHRQTLLRLIQQDVIETDMSEAWIKAVLSWPKEVLKTLLPKMTGKLLDAYVDRVGVRGLNACYATSPKALSSRHFFALRVTRLKKGGVWPKDRLLKRDDHGYDEVIETASNFLGIREARCWDMCLERMADKGEAVLQYLCDHAKDVMSPELTRWVDVVLARYAIAPQARLKALTSDVTTADVKFWPQQGPDGDDGDVYAYLRVHHSLKALSEVWSVRGLVPDDVRTIMASKWPNDAAWFELMLVLGPSYVSLIRQVMGMMDFKAPFGFRFDAHYRHSTIPKKSGGVRDIYAPERALKALQTLINVKLLQPLGAHDAAFGFVPGRNITGNAERHVGQSIVTTADIHSCFPSVGRGLVVHALKRDLGECLSYGAILKIADICLSQGVLPTGAPTSPALLNRVLLRTDELLTDAATSKGCTYTRYADDITFSGGEGAVSLLGVAKGVLKPIGLMLDPKKTNVFRRGRRQCCTGLVVNDRVSVNRETCRRLRAAVHALEMGRPLLWDGKPETVAQLRGRLAFLASVKAEEGARLMARLEAALRQKTTVCAQ